MTSRNGRGQPRQLRPALSAHRIAFIPARRAAHQPGDVTVWLPWISRAAARWLRGEVVAVAPEDQPAVKAAVRDPRHAVKDGLASGQRTQKEER